MPVAGKPELSVVVTGSHSVTSGPNEKVKLGVSVMLSLLIQPSESTITLYVPPPEAVNEGVVTPLNFTPL